MHLVCTLLIEFLTGQPIRFLRRNAGFGRLMLHYSSDAGVSRYLPAVPTEPPRQKRWQKGTPLPWQNHTFSGRGHFLALYALTKQHLRGRAGLFPATNHGEQKRHIKLLHIKLFPVAPVTGPPGRVSGQKDFMFLGFRGWHIKL